MKAAIQFTVAVAALAGLLGVTASHSATAIAELPLKASVLAKPNVIFGLDDSGSMDFEVMLPTNDGAVWWDYNAASAWDAGGKLWFNDLGNADSQWRKMYYLFPNGTATGARVYGDGGSGSALPPTAQLAFLRSPDYNRIYFNPKVTYKPWSPAHLGSGFVTPANATPTAAKSHPVIGTGTFDLTAARAASTTAEFTFTAFPGALVPAGASKRVCDQNNANCGAWTSVAADEVVPANQQVRVSMAYFPATYYLKESCSVNGSSCVSAPDGATLKRYEIKAANYATAAAYDAELQNFANWFQYHRKRKLMLNGAMGQVLDGLTGLNLGVVAFNNRPSSGTRVTMYDIDVTSTALNARRVAGIFYETDGSGGTPTRETLLRIGAEYQATSGGPVKFACQRNNAFVLTDGFALASNVSVPSYSRATWGTGVPYETTYDKSLADIALAHYTLNLRPDLAAGVVPKTAVDHNTNIHMNTYALTLGARGSVFLGDSTPLPTLASAWPSPTQNRHPSSVDDLWHATINGRGKMYLADTPEETALKVQAGLSDVLLATGAQGGVAVSTVNLSRGDSRAYFGTYNPSGWSGDLRANPIDKTTAAVDPNPLWSAGTQLLARNWTTRVIATANGTGGVGFTAANVGAVVNARPGGGNYGNTSQVMDYLRGDRSLENTVFRTRSSLMGAVINSEPVVVRDDGVVYVQSGEGMLHAFDTQAPNAGRELWAFVPRGVLPDIGATVERSYVFRTQLDGSPTVETIAGGRRLLVAGSGAGGRSYHALDVTSPRTLDEAGLAARFRWEFPAAGDAAMQAKVGQTLGRPQIVTLENGQSAVLLTSGYNNNDGRGRLWVLPLDANGSLDSANMAEFDTGVGSATVDAGLAHVTGFLEGNGRVRYAYGGDLLGNVWRFDLTAKTAPSLVAVLKGPTGTTQPVTTAPELIRIGSQRVVIVPTGRLLDIGDFGSGAVQSVYAIADGPTLANARTALQRQTYVPGPPESVAGTAPTWGTDRGWYMDLAAGEQANTRPTIAYGAVAFVTNKTGLNDCSASSRLYVLDVKSGGAYAYANYIGTTLSTTANSSAVTALLTSNGKIVGSGQDADGKPWQRDVTNSAIVKPAKNAWREVRRE